MLTVLSDINNNNIYEKLEQAYPNIEQVLEVINERDLICCLLESVNESSLPRLGYLISKNDYPLPLTYHIFDNSSPNKLKYKFNFDIFYDLLCLTDKSLAIVTGTKSTVRCGKSTLIPFIFPGLNQFSIYKNRIKMPEINNIDILCNDETSEDWVIADFNGFIDNNNLLHFRLFKSISAYSSLHVLNCKLEDFNSESGEPNLEILDVLNWYKKIQNEAKVLILIRDYNSKSKKFVELINSKINTLYSNINLIPVENLFDSKTDEIKLLSYRENFIKKINQEVLQSLNRKSMHSMLDVKDFYDKLCNNDNHYSYEKIMSRVETEFIKIFKFEGDDKINNLRSMFTLSNIYKQIEEYQLQLIKLYGTHEMNNDTSQQINALDKKLSELKRDKLNIKEPKNKFLKFFISLFEQDGSYLINLLIFEKCLLNFKKYELKELRELRQNASSELSDLDIKIKSEQSQNKKLDAKLQQKFANLQLILNETDEKINILDLTLDRFWDEIFLYFDWLDETKKSDSCKDLLIERYIDLLNKGFSIHLLRGNPLNIESSLLATILNKITKYKNIYVISVIGEQSSAKSSLLNSLFGCDFRTSAGRCTVGIYMNFVQYEEKTIVILDTEGLASIETSNKLFDNQMATMAVFCSHLIIINHKGEISTNLENILGITFFAKIHLTKLSFKPSILFILRDQTKRDESSVNGQATKLKERLIKRAEFVNKSLDDAIKIDTKNMHLLSNAFSEDKCNVLTKSVKWRNDIFPDQVLKLRQYLIEYLGSIDQQFLFNSHTELYSKMASYWKTIREAGDNIFNCKDLEEIKIRNEIIYKANELIEQNRSEFSRQLEERIDQDLKKLETNYDDQIKYDCENHIKDSFERVLQKVIDTYDSQTNITFYPESIKTEYRNRIRYQFNWIKDINMKRLNETALRYKNISNFNSTNSKLINQINDLLRSNYNYSEEEFMSMVKERFASVDNENCKKLNDLITPLNDLIQKSQIYYNQNVSFIMGMNNRFRAFPQITDLKKFYEIKDVDFKKWLSRNFLEKIKDKIWSNKDEKIYRIIEIYNTSIISNFPKINSTQISSTLINHLIYLVYDSLFDRTSPLNDSYNFVQVFNDLMKYTLCEMIKNIDQIQRQNFDTEKNKYIKFKSDLINKALNTFRSKYDSRNSGYNSGENFMEYFFNCYTEKKLDQITELNNKFIQNSFKSPTELVNYAYKSSFEISDYENIYKYVTDINRYCLECCLQYVKPQIEINIKDAELKFQTNCSKIMDFLINFQIFSSNEMPIGSIYDFIDKIINDIAMSDDDLETSICDLLQNVKTKMIDIEIQDIQLFVDGFRKSISNQNNALNEKLEKFKFDFNSNAKSEVKQYIEVFLGCNSTCPGCGSKCQNAKGHEGNHCSNKHIFDGFSGWYEIGTNNVVTRFCWEETKYLKLKILTDNETNEYESFKIYLEQIHPNWLYDVTENYNKLGKIQENSETLKFKREVIKAWMNTRKALMRKRNDKQYEQDWKDLEDEEKMLSSNHVAKWNDSF
ncbi:unnamed protein product [Brachionus calyciflorus]|uniref:VLIG-type G domain-containing protein n=1 Tax=Brachionus calyciflorus TaxID=104777 RepID=A0A813NT10_9BILA|nr:unnamed protein product [Brachionus calyciflorus]